MSNRASGSPTTKVGRVTKDLLPLSSPGNLRPFTESQNCRWLTPTTGGVMGVIAGKRHFEGPPEVEASSKSLGSAVSHGSVSVSDPSDVSGTRCIPSSPMVAGLLQTKGVPATDYSVWSGYPQQQTTASGLIQWEMRSEYKLLPRRTTAPCWRSRAKSTTAVHTSKRHNINGSSTYSEVKHNLEEQTVETAQRARHIL